jgi:hypothetical protein
VDLKEHWSEDSNQMAQDCRASSSTISFSRRALLQESGYFVLIYELNPNNMTSEQRYIQK